jgi:energy-coupling factor transport system substrate-specific component
VSWQLAAFAVLALALTVGFAWFERTRPDARIVALVATLAALAIVGRIAFAAVPNVKPSTDIVLVAGYALGGAPGFVVGAITGLVSNFFFGQGPWTPWQMAAWGVTGVLGAVLAVVTRGRIRRWQLAVVCTVIGFVFTVVQDVGDWVTYSGHSFSQLLTYVGTGLGFDAIDAAGCLIFALAFGPSLLRAIQRFALRIQVKWVVPSAAAVALIACIAGVSGIATRVQSASAAQSPLGYLYASQNGDGGLGPAQGQSSSPLFAGWAALAFASEGRNPAQIRNGGDSLLHYLEVTAGSQSQAGPVERTILIAHACGVPPTDFGGHDLVRELQRDIERNGSVGDQVPWTAFGVLALRAAGIRPSSRTLTWLIDQQDSDGGFSFGTKGDPSDVDDTGAVLEALARVSGHRASTARARAIKFIRRQQNSDGGFPSEVGGFSDSQSTAWAIQGLIAAGVNPYPIHTRDGLSPERYLRNRTTPNGSVNYSKGVSQDPVWVTAEAVPALAGKPLPIARF